MKIFRKLAKISFLFCIAPHVYGLQFPTKTPLEFHFLIYQLSAYQLHKEEIKTVKESLKQINDSLAVLPQSISQRMLKSVIFRFLLENTPELKIDSNKLDRKSLSKLNDHYMNNFSNYYIFSKWLIESIMSDLWNYFVLPSKAHKSGMALRGIKYVIPWYHVAIRQDASQLNLYLRPLLLNILKEMAFQLRLINQLGRFKTPIAENLHYKDLSLNGKKYADPLENWELYRKLKQTEALRAIGKEVREEKSTKKNEWKPREDATTDS